MSTLLGIDIGTSGCKVVLVDEARRVVASATNGYPLSTPRAAWSEQNPADWWDAAWAGVRDVRSKIDGPVDAIGLTGQMHGLVLLDDAGEVIRPAILWNDQRSAPQCAAITERVGFRQLIDWTGNQVLPGFTIPKLLWVREHEPEAYARIAHVLLPKDYIRYRLTGVLGTDVSDASGTLVFDVRNRRWCTDMMRALDVPTEWWPVAAESPVVSARVSTIGADATGLSAGTPVVAGAGDNAAGAVATGVVDEGALSIALGTSGVVFAATEAYRPEADGRLHAFCHAVPDRWHLTGVTLSAAGSLQWWRDAIAPDTPFADLVAEAAGVAPGSDGLTFLPYLSGERTPHNDPDARGAFVGLSLQHKRAHMTRAVLEGVAFSLRDVLEVMNSAGVRAEEALISGGGAASELWTQIVSDVLGLRLIPSVDEGPAFGAALLAGVGAGVWADVPTACRPDNSRPGATNLRVVEPSDHVDSYSVAFAAFRNLYPTLRR